jgi:hypothetical protein
MSGPPAPAPRRVAIAVISVPCITCGAKPEQDCKNQAPQFVKKPRYHKARTEMARRVGLEYVDTLQEIDKLPDAAPR